jgi:hypothetical protein
MRLTSHACKSIILMNVKDVLDSQCSTKEIPSCCVDDSLWLSSRSRSVQNEQRVFTVHRSRSAVWSLSCAYFMIPLISALAPFNLFIASSLDYNAVFDFRAFFESGIDNALCCNSTTTSLSLVGSNYDSSFTIICSVTK